MLEIFGTNIGDRKYMRSRTCFNEIVFQSSSIDVLLLEYTSIDFILSKNNEKPMLPGNSRTEL
jgi:hypothetical protein